MATLNQILAKQAELIAEAKKTLEDARKKAPPTNAPIVLKEATVAELKARKKNLTAARDDVVQQINAQIEVYRKEIMVLEQQIKDDKQ